MAAKNVLSRREFVKDTGGLLIGFSFAEGSSVAAGLVGGRRNRRHSIARSARRLAAY